MKESLKYTKKHALLERLFDFKKSSRQFFFSIFDISLSRESHSLFLSNIELSSSTLNQSSILMSACDKHVVCGIIVKTVKGETA